MESLSVEPADDCLLEVRHVCKAFPGVLALEAVSLRVRRGSVHALVGENGAGKSTLMKIIAGIYRPDSGELLLRGRALRLDSPRDAQLEGIAMIHQELNLMPSMSVAENIWLGREPVSALGFVRHRELHRRTRALLQRLRLDVDPEAPVRTLSVAERQLIEIARALSCRSELLIMDEPTSALTGQDAQRLFAIMRGLKEQRTGILYITHRLDELAEIADEISVFRDGRRITTSTPAALPREAMIRMMVGREVADFLPSPPTEPDQSSSPALCVRHLSRAPHFQDVSFELRTGEILGVAGLVGSGRSQLAEALFGVSPAGAGQIFIRGTEVSIDSPRAAMAYGMAYLTEDRKETGCFLSLSVIENLQICVLGRQFVRLGFLRVEALTRACETMSRSLRVKTPDLHQRIEHLSGGNQQKVLIGRWLLTLPSILILDEPTRGVDVGAKAEIHQLITALVAEGAAVLMISSELPEVLAMSHRVMVMHEGRVTGILPREQANQVSIMELAAQ